MGHKTYNIAVGEEAVRQDITIEQGMTLLIKWLATLPPTGLGLSNANRGDVTAAKLQIRNRYGGSVILTADSTGAYLTFDNTQANQVSVMLDVPFADTNLSLPTTLGRSAVPTLTQRTRLGVYDLWLLVENGSNDRKWKLVQGDVYIVPRVTI